MQDLIDDVVVQWRRRWPLWLCFISCFSHLCFVLYPIPIGCIDAKCLTQCQSQLRILRPSPKGDFHWSTFLLCFNDFWKLQQVLGRRLDSRLEKWLKSWGCSQKIRKFGPYSLASMPMRETLGFWSLPHPYLESDYGLRAIE